MSTKKDFEKMAKAFADQLQKASPNVKKNIRELIAAYIEIAKTGNPRFDEIRFKKAIRVNEKESNVSKR